MGEDNVSREEFNTLKQTVELHDRVLRGHNGEPGLVGSQALIKSDIQFVKRDVSEMKEDVCDVKNTLNGTDGHVGLVGNVHLILNAILKKDEAPVKKNEDSITFKYLIDKFAAPIITGLAIGLIMLLFT